MSAKSDKNLTRATVLLGLLVWPPARDAKGVERKYTGAEAAIDFIRRSMGRVRELSFEDEIDNDTFVAQMKQFTDAEIVSLSDNNIVDFWFGLEVIKMLVTATEWGADMELMQRIKKYLDKE